MNEVIGSILEAEAKAEEISRAAKAESRRLLEEGAAAAEAIRKDAERRLIAEREACFQAAERMAQARYEELLAAGKAKAEALRAEAEAKVGTAARSVFGKVFS